MEMTTKRWILLGVGVFGMMALCAGGIGALVYGVFSFTTEHEAYRLAEAQAKASPEVQARVGAVTRVEIDWSGGTSLQESTANGVTSGTARYSLVATGERGPLPLCAQLSADGGPWQLDALDVGVRCADRAR